MVKKCIYCGSEVNDECVIDFCERCGIKVWGEKMFRTILRNMEDARSRGDLLHTQKQFFEEREFKEPGFQF